MMNERADHFQAKYSLILYYCGILILFSSSSFLFPIISLLFYPEEKKLIFSFLPSVFLAVIIGGTLTRLFHKSSTSNIKITTREGGIVVVFSWLIIIFLSALPFRLGMDLNLTQSLFESVSGWTTTGLSVVNESLTPRIFLFWRSIMQFLGGAGITVIALSAILPVNDLSLYRAEARSDKLLPHVKKSTQLIIKLYSGFVAGGIIFYIIAGMGTFDAINHAMAALSTGGFSTLENSIGGYNSLSIEIITMFLMLLGTINFATHYTLVKGKIKSFFKNAEIRVLAWMLIIFSLIFIFIVEPAGGELLSQEARDSLFQIFSALSTTGFSTIDFTTWPALGTFLIIIIMLIGGGTGSTAGGIKQYRIYLAVKSIYWTVRDELLPRWSVKEDYVLRGEDKVYIDNKQLKEVFIYITLYLITFFLGSAFFIQAGYPVTDSMFEFASTQGTVGLSMGITGPNLQTHLLWVQMLGMFLGRLEFMVIIISLSRLIKDIAGKVNYNI